MKTKDLKLRSMISAWVNERDKEILARKNKWDLEVEICNYLNERMKPSDTNRFDDLVIGTGYRSVWDQWMLKNLSDRYHGDPESPVSKTYSVEKKVLLKIAKKDPDLYERINGMRYLARRKPRFNLLSNEGVKIKFPIRKLKIYDRKTDIPNLKEEDIDFVFTEANDFDI